MSFVFIYILACLRIYLISSFIFNNIPASNVEKRILFLFLLIVSLPETFEDNVSPSGLDRRRAAFPQNSPPGPQAKPPAISPLFPAPIPACFFPATSLAGHISRADFSMPFPRYISCRLLREFHQARYRLAI